MTVKELLDICPVNHYSLRTNKKNAKVIEIFVYSESGFISWLTEEYISELGFRPCYNQICITKWNGIPITINSDWINDLVNGDRRYSTQGYGASDITKLSKTLEWLDHNLFQNIQNKRLD